MKKNTCRLKSNRGSISTVVIVTVLFFTTVLSASFTIMSNVRKAQMKDEILVKDVYENQIKDAPNIEQTLKNKEIEE